MPTCIINFVKEKPKSTFKFTRQIDGIKIEKKLKQDILLNVPNIPLDPNIPIITLIYEKSILVGDKFSLTRGLEFGKNDVVHFLVGSKFCIIFN